jgi:hypothetical protein
MRRRQAHADFLNNENKVAEARQSRECGMPHVDDSFEGRAAERVPAPTHVQYAYCEGAVVEAAHEARAAHAAAPRLYVCPGCRGGLDLRRTTVKEDGGRYNVPGYFAHYRRSSTCAGATGESLQHLRCKYYLQRYVGHYDFCLESCGGCADNLGLVTKSSWKVELEKRVVIDGTLFVYDVLISRGDRAVVAVEVLHTHKTEERKLECSAKHGIRVVEVSTEDVLSAVPRLEAAKLAGGSVTLPNLLEKKTCCSACQALRVYDEYASEGWEAWRQDSRSVLRSYFEALEAYAHGAVRRMRLCASVRSSQLAYARAVQERRSFEKRNRKRKSYARGDTKCCGCATWGQWTIDIPRSKWTRAEYQQVQWWFFHNGRDPPPHAKACDLCTMRCPGCMDWFTVDLAVKWGLCYDCNRCRWASEP